MWPAAIFVPPAQAAFCLARKSFIRPMARMMFSAELA
jgi:hypothetical protein